MTEMNNKTKFYIFGVLITTLFLVSALRLSYLQTASSNADPIGTWMKYFVERSYSSCDTLVKNKSDKLLAENIESYGTHEESENMYITLLDMCTESITNVDIEMSSKTDATISVKYKPYKRVNKVVVSEEKLEGIKTKYLNGELADSDLHAELSALYSDSFRPTVGGSTKDEVSTSITLKVEDGKVVGTHKAVVELLESMNLLDNLKLFEDEVSSTITVLLHK